jgi:membrane-associated protease RseP (regulator of RpoE activity)
MLVESQIESLTNIISQQMQISDITWGDEKQNFLVRFRGQLTGDSARAYDEIATAIKPYHLTPLFRKDNEQAVILLVQGVANPKPSNPWINLGLFIATVFSVLYAGALYSYNGPSPDNLLGQLLAPLKHLKLGIPFAVSLLAILLAHEFGHYLAGRYHKTVVTLPYFIPFPLSPFGTMGAAIQLKEPPKNKRILLDIGLAGPIAGLVVAIPVLIYGLTLSKIAPLPTSIGGDFVLQIEGNSIIYLLSKYLVFHQWLPVPLDFNGVPPLLYWIRYFFTGEPSPLGGLDVIINPIAWAGWAGLLVTALNLIPAGQLDGGHLAYTWLGKKALYLWPFILVGLVLLGFVWSGWWLWALLIFFLGRLYAEPLDQITPLNRSRKALAILGLVIFLLVFMPVPLKII